MKSAVKTATILVVDDEPSVLQFAERVLSGSGYRVLLAPDAEAALRMFEREEAGICLVVSDITMPGMNGVQLVERIRRISPGTPALLLSGASETEIGAHLPFLPKPFTPHDLVAKVDEVSAGGAS